MALRILNRTRGTVLATRAETAGESGSRRRGLLGRESLEAGEGLWIVPCEAVHCFFMKFTIDVVFLDRKKRVVKVRPSLRPWRISGSLRAHSVLELPEGTIRATGTQPGDELEFEETGTG
ncbi:MAG: hypothetical protein KatS3mg004_2618 [Bryobacteraceae bacterium]|nr:MAG: hypothetical protein KatS3mg004_2618 [Bryobacteraceae bacterium]